MAVQVFFHLVLFTLFSGVAAWKCAKYEHYFSQQPDYIDCFWDCCGNSFNRHCCAPIGIIVGCCIISSVVVAGLVVVCSCWMHRRRAKTKGPKRLSKRRHSHYPVAPSSVTRPAPMMEKSGYGPPQGRGYGPPPPGGRGYGPPPPGGRGYGPPPDRGQGPQSEYRSEKPAIDDFYNERPEMTSTMGRTHVPPPNRGHPQNRGPPSNRGPPRRDETSSNDEYSDFEQRGPPRGGYRPAPAPSRPVQPPPQEFLEL